MPSIRSTDLCEEQFTCKPQAWWRCYRLKSHSLVEKARLDAPSKPFKSLKSYEICSAGWLGKGSWKVNTATCASTAHPHSGLVLLPKLQRSFWRLTVMCLWPFRTKDHLSSSYLWLAGPSIVPRAGISPTDTAKTLWIQQEDKNCWCFTQHCPEIHHISQAAFNLPPKINRPFGAARFL